MKTEYQQLQPSEITSEVFVISPSQIDYISQNFTEKLAEELNLRPLAYKIQQIAKDALIYSLKQAKKMGE
ncbi:MAG: hypothetical protein MJ156_01795 [Alphaproteobacteria bacterium]|nr:hypothetical protein [Alphaproteobacteria bacterium]